MIHQSNNQDTRDIFKPGFHFEVKVLDFESQELQNLIQESLKAQKECLQRKEVSFETLTNRVYDI